MKWHSSLLVSVFTENCPHKGVAVTVICTHGGISKKPQGRKIVTEIKDFLEL